MNEFQKILIQCKIKGTVDKIDFLRLYEYFCKLYHSSHDYIYITSELRMAYFKFEDDSENWIFYKDIAFLDDYVKSCTISHTY